MGWVRLDSAWFRDKRHRPLGLFGNLALLAAVTMSEERDWRRGGRYGFVPRAEFDAEEIARHLELVGDRVLLGFVSYEQLLGLLQSGVLACERAGLLERCGDEGWFVPIADWSRYRKDPTANDRQRKSRRERAARGSSPQGRHGGHSDNRDSGGAEKAVREAAPDPARVTDVTVTNVTEAGAGSESRALSDAPEPRHGDIRDGRDVTPRPPPEEGLTAPPPPEAGTAAAPSAAAPAAAVDGEAARRRLEDDVRGITFDRTDQRRPRALVLWNSRASSSLSWWREEADALMREPRRRPGAEFAANGNGAVREAAHA